jgi:hypothetical protein
LRVALATQPAEKAVLTVMYETVNLSIVEAVMKFEMNESYFPTV